MSKITYFTCEQLDDAKQAECSNKSYVAIKKCRMLRSGVQLYARDEVPGGLLSALPPEKQNQQIFKVYRRPEAIVKHLKDFNYIAFVNRHPDEDVTPDNYQKLSIGTVGGNAKLVTLDDDDGNVYVENDVVFTSKDAYNEYKEGKKEVSIGLEALWRISDNEDYDFEVFDFTNVNHLALVSRARAGHEAKIMDSSAVVDRFTNTCGGKQMKGFLKMFGIKKTEDADQKKVSLSASVFAGIEQMKKEMKDEDIDKVVNPVMDCISALGDTEQKKVLVGVVSDAFKDYETVMGADEEAKKKLADTIDALYAKCVELDEESAQKIIADACGKDEKPVDDEKPEGKDEPDDKTADEPAKDEKPCDCDKPADNKDCKDADVIGEKIEAAIAKALDGLDIEAKVDAAVRKALNLDSTAKVPEAKGANTDSAPAYNFNSNDLLPSGWGN